MSNHAGITPRRIVGLCGYARAGKDTVAQALVDRGWARVGFADALKADLEAAIGKPFAAMPATEKELWRPTMVAYGEARRRQWADYWIARAVDTIQNRYAPSHPIVITDVRYVNELDWIRRCGGVVLYVERELLPANSEEEMSIRKCLDRIYPVDWLYNFTSVEAARERLIMAVENHYGPLGAELEGWEPQ